ncbi:MAG: Uncharacterised protein [Flavobacteriales bacterium UBA4585]|nr:MAG: Uncharacterised protein [Flavobacteriales bacterium UBA4585]
MHIPVFTHATRKAIGRWALYLAIFSFIAHLLLHLFRSYIPGGMEAALLKDPISAIYTPFSILLVYEAYLMIYYLRRSTTIYIAKQYEVISLILIRGLFKDMAALDLKIATWSSQHNLEFAADIILVVLAFYLVYWFYRLSGTYKYADFEAMEQKEIGPRLKQFIQAKNYLSLILFVVFVILGFQSFFTWIVPTFQHIEQANMVAVNAIFFEQFYNFLIISDVIILLLSFLYSDNFPVIIRNSSFVISTIMLKLSFTAEGLLSQILILLGIGFGVLMLHVHNKYKALS